MAAFTNDDLKTLGAFDQAQGSTNDQLRLLRAVANRIGLYDAADALTRLIFDTVAAEKVAEVEEPVAEAVDLDTLSDELEALSTGSLVTLDEATSDRIADAMATIADEEAIAFLSRIMVGLKITPAYTPKVIAMSNRFTAVLLGAA